MSFSELEQEIIREGAKAMRATRGEVTGRTMLEVRDSLITVLRSDAFARFRELVDQHSRLDFDPSDYVIRSVTFGIEAAFALVVGAQGSFGIGVPPGQWDNVNEYVIYVTGSLEAGFVEGAFGGVVLGLYNVQPTDLAGGSWAFAVELGFIEEVEVERSTSNAAGTDLLGYSFTEAAGEDEGLDGLYSMTYVMNWDTPHIYQPPNQKNYMMLNSIQCVQEGESGHDEIYFTFQPDDGLTYRYPTHGQYSMAHDDAFKSWYPHRSIWFDDHVTIQLWDDDDTSSDDTRGSHTYSVSGFQTSVQVSGSGGTYTLNASLNPSPAPFLPPKRINSADTSKDGPGVCEFNGRFYAVWRGSANDGIYFSASTDGVQWPYGARINTTDTTSASPSAIAFNGQIFVFFRGSNSGVFWTTGDGVASFPAAHGLTNEFTSTPPAPCVFNGSLYLFWTLNDSSKRIVWSRFDPASNAWSAHQTINGLDWTDTGVAACVFNNKIYLFWKGGTTNANIYVTSSGTTSFPNAGLARSGETTSHAPSVCLYENRLYLIFIGNDPSCAVRYMSSSDGSSFTASVRSGANVSQLPATALSFASAMRLCFTNTQSQLVTSQSTF